MEDEDDVSYTTHVNGMHGEKVLRSSNTCMDRKRKLQAEELGVPPTKLHWLSREFTSKYDYLSDTNSDTEGVHRWEVGGESTKDSNSVAAVADSSISISNDADLEMDRGSSKECSSYWAGNSYKNVTDSLESGWTTKSCSTSLESSSTDKEHQFAYYEEDLLEFGSHIDCSCYECITSNEKYTEKEIEDILHRNGMAPDNYVLSSGRWTLKQGAQPGTERLTIDKEFEQYFSTLML